MDSGNIQHAIWAAFFLFAILLMASCAKELGRQDTEEQVKYIESDCKKGPVNGSSGTHWICD